MEFLEQQLLPLSKPLNRTLTLSLTELLVLPHGALYCVSFLKVQGF
jgi:hypothetical protein